MILTELIREQAFQTAVMFGAGVFVATGYCIFKWVCRIFEMPVLAAYILEILFWIFAAVAAYKFLYYCAYGGISFHAALSFTAGALLWKKIFCGIIDKIYTKLFTKQGIYNKYGEKEKKQPVQRHQPGDRH